EEQLEKDYNKETGEFTDDGYKKALEKLNELDSYFTSMPNAVTDDTAINDFVNEEAAIYYNQFNQFLYIETGAFDIGWFNLPYIEPGDFEIGMFNIPIIEEGEGDQYELTGSPQGFMVSSKTEHPDVAVEFLEFITSKEESSRLVEETGMISSSIGGVNEDNASPEIIEMEEMIEEASSMNIWMDIILDAKISEVYLNSVTEMLNEDKTTEEVMNDVQEISQEIK